MHLNRTRQNTGLYGSFCTLFVRCSVSELWRGGQPGPIFYPWHSNSPAVVLVWEMSNSRFAWWISVRAIRNAMISYHPNSRGYGAWSKAKQKETSGNVWWMTELAAWSLIDTGISGRSQQGRHMRHSFSLFRESRFSLKHVATCQSEESDSDLA